MFVLVTYFFLLATYSFNTVSFNKIMQVEFDHHLNFFASKLIFEELLLHI
jgi:hypothetical protein